MSLNFLSQLSLQDHKLVEDRFEQKMIWNELLNTYKELLN